MKKGLLTVIIILALLLAGAVFYVIRAMENKNVLAAELKSVKVELFSTNTTLAITKETLSLAKQTLDATQAELTQTKQVLVSTNQTLVSTQSQLHETELSLASTESQLTAAQQDAIDLAAELAYTQEQLAVARETLDGLGITLSESKECHDADLIDNTAATNPTWSQLKAFLSDDKTETNTYIRNVYDCSEFSRDVHNNAEAAGIRAAEVNILFEDEDVGHALNAFLTTDYGLVYIDCTEKPDTVANIKTGKEFRAVDLRWIVSPANVHNQSWWDSRDTYYYIQGSSGGHAITAEIHIFW